jgi:hypothetical protein
MTAPARRVVDLVTDDGAATRFVPGVFARDGLPLATVPGVTWQQADPARPGGLVLGLAAPDSAGARDALRDAGWLVDGAPPDRA